VRMSRDIEQRTQQNLWGVADTVNGLEPQRSDLFYVDFSTAAKGVSKAANIVVREIKPHYIRSVTLPEIRTKAEPIRRDSVAANMPSWDDPLDAVKVSFLLDTNDRDDTSTVVEFLDGWLALTRAGRGSRTGGYVNQLGWLSLNSKYTIDFRFDVVIRLLRGATATDSASGAAAQFQQNVANQYQQAVVANRFLNSLAATEASKVYNEQVWSKLVDHQAYRFVSAWLGSYKMSDLNYNESGLVSVEATFYVDDVVLGGSVNTALHGSATIV